MRSIRFSLTVCFVLLLGLALGTASVLAYQSAKTSIQGRLNAQKELAEARYKDLVRDEENRLDEALLFQAQTIARIVQFHVDWGKLRFLELHTLGILSSPLSPNGHITSTSWIIQSNRAFATDMFRKNTPEVRFDQTEIFNRLDGQVAEFFQFDTAWNASYKSNSLGSYSLPLNREKFAPEEVLHWEFEDVKLSESLKVRKVALKASRFLFGPSNRGSSNRGSRGSSFSSRDRNERQGNAPLTPPTSLGTGNESPFRPAIFIQCAYDIAKRDAKFQAFLAEKEEELATFENEQNASLKLFRDRLIAINISTFVFGGFICLWLVKLGLEPLRNLSLSVSRINEKEFRLDTDTSTMPVELQPISIRLENTLALLQKAFNREKQATADITHELRTPLAAMITTLDVALRKSRTAEEYKSILEEIRGSCGQMHGEVERLLTLARLDAGADSLRPETFELSSLCIDCIQMIRPLADKKSVTISMDGIDSLEITTDPGKLKEILTNLLHNSIQYNRHGGWVSLGFYAKPGSIIIEVRDNGIGIRKENLTRVFERFYREDPSRGHGDLTNSGLGLAIVKGFVELLGGTITVESSPETGSTFKIVLPAPVSKGSSVVSRI